MKTFLILFTLLFSLTGGAMTRPEIEALLKEKGHSLVEMEMRGLRLLMGEVTGHIPFSKVQVLITEQEAIMKSEIDSVDFSGGQTLGGVSSVRFKGQYVLRRDVKATIVQ